MALLTDQRAFVAGISYGYAGCGMTGIAFSSADIRDIELIRPLWEQLNEHHHEHSHYFRAWYETWNFDDRKAYFEHVAKKGLLRIELAEDTSSSRAVGYCVGSLSPERDGEIESIFVEPPYRHIGTGSELMLRILAWLDTCGAVRKRVSVGNGNEAAWEFYRRFGFYPRLTVLEQKKE